MSATIRSVIVAAAAGAVLFGSAGLAAAQDPPNCTPADLAGIQAGVSAATSTYLFSHPDVNATLARIDDLPKAERHAQLQSFFDTNPMVKDELNNIRKPVVEWHQRCPMNTDTVSDGG
jgi:hemophore-related protein